MNLWIFSKISCVLHRSTSKLFDHPAEEITYCIPVNLAGFVCAVLFLGIVICHALMTLYLGMALKKHILYSLTGKLKCGIFKLR